MNADQAKELQQSALWQTLVEEMDRRIDLETQKLLHCTPTELVQLQERIFAMQVLTRIPQDVIDRES